MSGKNQDKRLAKTQSRQAKARKPNRQKASEQTQTAPVSQSTKSKGRQPRIMYKSDGSCCTVAHKERIGTVLGSVAFTTTQYSINPGLVTSFPWLSAIANRFEAYRFKKLVFHYKTKTATTALGDVILVTDYDAADNAPESSIQAESYQAYADCAPWQNQSMSASRQNLEKFPQRYTRDTAPPSGTDIKTYDVGNFFICTENQASAALVGYLYVEYEVELFTPQLRSADFYISGGAMAGGGTMTAANVLGTTATLRASTRGVSVSAAGVVTVANPGTYMVSMYATGTVMSVISVVAGSNCSVTNYYNTNANGAGTVVTRVSVLVVTGFNATCTFTATATTVTASEIAFGSVPVASMPLASVEEDDFVMIESDTAKNLVELKKLKTEIIDCRDPARRATLLNDYKGLAERVRQ